MQKLESVDFKIDEKPLVLIAYLRLWVAKRPQRKRSKTKPNTGDIIESPGGYFGSPWGHLGGRLVVLGAPLGVLGDHLGAPGVFFVAFWPPNVSNMLLKPLVFHRF